MSGIFGSQTSTPASTAGDLSKDVELANPPTDSISDIVFSGTDLAQDFLAVGSWDSKVRIYEIDSSGKSEGKHMYEHKAPVLSCDYFRDGTKVVSGGADKAVMVCDLATLQTQQIGIHDQPVRSVRFFESNGSPMVVTGSWDKKIKYWDMRQQTPVGDLTMQERVYSMDVRANLLVVGTADRYINVINLLDPGKMYKTMQSPLKWQTRVISCFTDSQGFAIGSIEGRCAIQYVEDKDASSNFSFKCHRDAPQGNTTNVHAVNAISFHPVHGTFSTAGSDGTFHFWDKDAKHRLKGYPTVGGSITSTAFNRDGNIFAYAVSYDWSKGHQGNSPNYPNKVMLHPVNAEECKPRPSVKKR